MRLRAASPGDAAAIAQVHVAAWHAAYRGLIPDSYLAETPVYELRYGKTSRPATPW